jgi:hypothetical protein
LAQQSSSISRSAESCVSICVMLFVFIQ